MDTDLLKEFLLYCGREGYAAAGDDTQALYGFLRKALAAVPDDAPYRGPHTFTDGNLHYTNNWQGGLERFSGEERIMRDGQDVYQARYIGGVVDKT